MELTERAFLDAIRPIVAQAEKIEGTFKVKSNEKQPSFLTVGGSGTHVVIVLPKILRAFKHNHPWVQFALERNDSRDGTTHFKCRGGNCSSYSDQIAYEPYKEMEIVAFPEWVKRGYPVETNRSDNSAATSP
jgi:hypothetical protein